MCKRCASMHAYVRACVCAISWMDMGGWVRVQALCFNACVRACMCVRLHGWIWVGGCVCKRCVPMHAYVRACVCAPSWMGMGGWVRV